MAESPAPDSENKIDALSQLQGKLDDFGVMFYTYVGVIQRDAPPEARAPDEADEVPNDEAIRKDLAEKAPEYAQDILRTYKEIDELINKVEKDLEGSDAEQKTMVQQADAASVAAGTELESAALQATKLLADVRSVIALRDQDEMVGRVQNVGDRMSSV